MERTKIDMIRSGRETKTVGITEEQWAAINYIDYVDMDSLPDMVDDHGITVVVTALSYFGV